MDIVPSPEVTVQNGHARLSYRKVAELLEISHSTIVRLINGGALFNAEEAKSLLRHGFDGGALSNLLDYLLFDSKRIAPETKEHCRDIYRKASAKGFQDFIDAIAGIPVDTSSVAPTPTPRLTSYDRANAVINLKDALQAFDVELTNPRFKQELQDLALDVLGIGTRSLPGTSEVWLGVAERAEQLGYPASKVCKSRSLLGKYVKSLGLEYRQENRLCNGTQRPVNLYRLTPELDTAIDDYMTAE